MITGRGRKSLYIVAVLALLAHSSEAPAQTPSGAQSGSDAKKACLVQHEAAQNFRRTGKLLEARDAVLVCSRDECPAVVRVDCGDWLELVNKTLPSLVFRVKLDDRDVSDVRVSVDGKVVKSHLDGSPFELNPGPHSLRFEYSTFEPISQDILVLEGEKNRVVAAAFAKAVPVSVLPPPKAPEAPAPVETYRPTPVITYVLGGVALAGVAGFATFGALGQSEKKALETSCRPVCSNDDLKPVQTRFLLADVSLGIAVVSAVTAGIVYLARPSKPLPPTASQGKGPGPASRFAFGISPTPSGAQFAMGTEF